MNINSLVKRKQYLWMGIVGITVAAFVGAGWYLSEVDLTSKAATQTDVEPAPDMTGVVESTFDDKVQQHATTEMQVAQSEMTKEFKRIQQEIDLLSKGRLEDQKRLEQLTQENANLKTQVSGLGQVPVGEPKPTPPMPAPGPEGEPQPTSFPPQGGNASVPPPTAFYPGAGATIPPQVSYQPIPVPNQITRKTFNYGDSKAVKKLPYIPSGSFAKSILIEGADADASVTGNESTVPMQIRLIGKVEMPNSKTYDLTGCFVGLEAWGDVSSERAIVRTRNISCLKNGNTIDQPIKGHVSFMGKNGVKGEVVMRNGKILGWAGAAGFLDGIGEGMKSVATPSVGIGATASVGAGDVFKSGLGGGGSKAAQTLSDYYINDDRSYAKLVDTLLSIKIDKLRAYLKSTPAANLVDEKIEKTAISIRAVLTNYVKAIRYLQGIERNGEPFTIRDWMRGVREDGNNGWLFISSNADTHASLKPVISMWLSLAIRGLLAMGENRQRRVWIFADELPTLHKLPDLVEILPEARKFGGCYVLGFQSYAQLEDIYGAKGAATLFDVLNTRAFFRSPSKQIADFAAGEIGEKEQLKASEQYSYGVDPVRDGTSVGKDMERVTLVSYSDIQTLPDLTCYITLPGPYPAVKLPLKYQTRPKVAPEFIARSIDTDAETHLSAVLAAREEEGRGIAELFTPDAEADVPAATEKKSVAETPTQTTPPVAPCSAENAAKPGPKVSSKAAAPAATLTATSSTTAASATAAAVVAPVGGVEQELEEHEEALPPGIDSQGELVDPDAYERWQAEHEANGQRTMQRREEVNINHGQSSHDDVEVGDTF